MKGLPRLLLLTVLTASFPAWSGAQDTRPAARIIAVLASDVQPYQEALQGVRDYATQHLPHAQISAHILPRAKAAPAVNASLFNEPADLYVALGTAALDYMRQAGVTRPIVAGMVLNAAELAQSGNVTGVVLELPVETEIEWMLRFLPDKPRVGLLYSPGPHAQQYVASDKLLAARGRSLPRREVTSPQQLPAALKALERDIDVLWGIPDPLVYTPQTAKEILLFSFRNRIPMVGLSRAWVKGGALYALDRDYRDIGMQSGELVKKLLDGTPAASLPPVYPRKIVYAINLKTARHMKVDLEPALLKGAMEVVE